jgi:hypothetical protein
VGRLTSGDFELTETELRVVALYVLEAAAGVLPVFEAAHPEDRRPRDAISAARGFVDGAPRSKLLRVASMDAHRAAADAATQPSRLAAQAAGDAASAAYLHPLARAHQVGHILRAAANAARIAELDLGADAASREMERARRRASPTLVDVLRRYPAAQPGTSRIAQLTAELDAALRRGSA